jgi:hypothetical protein
MRNSTKICVSLPFRQWTDTIVRWGKLLTVALMMAGFVWAIGLIVIGIYGGVLWLILLLLQSLFAVPDL